MGFRFRKSIKIAPGLRVNIGKRGASSVTIGPRGSSVSVGRSGTYVNTGIPGTGVSYRQKIGGSKATRGSTAQTRQPSPAAQKISGLILMAIIGGGVWLGTNRDPAKAPASEKPATSAAPASPTTSPWHSIGGYTIGMGIEEAKRLGATNCKTSTQGQECSIPDGNAFGAPYSRGHISFAGAPATASQIRVGVNASVMPAVTATLGQPSIRKGGSRKILYWNRGEDIVVSRTSETLSVSRQPSLASQLIPRK